MCSENTVLAVCLFVKTISFHLAVDTSACSITQVSLGEFVFAQHQKTTARNIALCTSIDQDCLRVLSHTQKKRLHWFPSHYPSHPGQELLIIGNSLNKGKKVKKAPWPPRVLLSPTPTGTSAGKRQAHQPRVPFPRAGRG